MLSTYFQITCQSCDEQRVENVITMHQQLSALGKLTKQVEPDLEILLELFRITPETATCDACGKTSVSIAPLADEFDDLSPRRCVLCNAIIATERLEVLPHVETCTPCSANPNGPLTSSDFCSLCGDLVSVESTRRRGITQYISRCNGCGHEN